MSNYVKKLVYLTEAQKNALFQNGSITVDGKTIVYDPNDVYVTPKDLPEFHIGDVETLPAGEDATASITGTKEDPVLNLGLVTGATGPQGPKGDKGDPGEVTQAEFDALADDVSDIQDTLEHKADIDGYYTDMTVGAAEQVVSSTMVEDNAPYKFRTSGGSTDIGNRAYVDKIVGGTVAWNQQVRDAASENVTEYADAVTVTDAVEDDAAVSVMVEPVQDLHGYDAPWPAGGGKNLFNWDRPQGTPNPASAYDSPRIMDIEHFYVGMTRNNYYGTQSITDYSVDNGTISVSVSAGGYGIGYPVSVIPNQVYSVSFTNVSNAKISVGFYDADWNFVSHIDNVTYFNVPQNVAYASLIITPLALSEGHGAAIAKDIQLELGSTATSFAPYENICPITGWDEVKVWDDPRYGGLVEWNQFIPNTNANNTVNGITYTNNRDGSWTVRGTATGGTAYYNLASAASHAGHKVLFWYGVKSVYNTYRIGDFNNGITISYNTDAVIVIDSLANISLGVQVYDTKTIDITLSPMAFDLTQMFGETKADEIYAMEQAEAGAGVAYFRSLFQNDYYPYNAGETMTVGQVNGEAYRHYTIEMPTDAGTVYGGELTVNKDGTGQLVVDRAMATLDGTNNAIRYRTAVTGGAYLMYAEVSNMANGNSGTCCDYLKIVSWTDATGGQNYTAVAYKNSSWDKGRVGFFIDSITEINDANTWLQNNNVSIVYKLATPLTYSLTATQVQTLLGTNNVWSDAGQVALTYTGTDEHLVLTTGRKYLTRISGTDSVVLGAGQEVTAVKGRDNVFDLTQMFGTAVADYVYQQGAGYFRRWFGDSHYAYNAGELISVQGVQSREVVGFNCYDNGTAKVLGDNQYQITGTYTALSLDGEAVTPDANGLFTLAKTGVLTVTGGGSDTCVHLTHSGTRNGSYEPYTRRSYPLDSTLTLRGIPKVYSNGVYWDGDEYGYDGGVKRRYGVVDLGTLNWNYQASLKRFNALVTGIKAVPVTSSLQAICVKYSVITGQAFDADITVSGTLRVDNVAAMIYIRDLNYSDKESLKNALSGVYLVYELATPTTETATPYQQIQSVDDWGTEEFVSTSIVPIGHETRFPANLRDKLQHLPALASANGSYLITQTDGQMVLSPFPAPPTAAGNYLLKATVSGGNATYSWVAQ